MSQIGKWFELWAAYKAGKSAQQAVDTTKTTEVQDAEQEAEAAGPRTVDDVEQRLRDGKF